VSARFIFTIEFDVKSQHVLFSVFFLFFWLPFSLSPHVFFLFLFFLGLRFCYFRYGDGGDIESDTEFFYRDFGRSSQGPIFFSGDFFSGAGVGEVNRRGVREDSLRDILFKNRAIDY
jgi:hypothetical protein